ERELLGYIAEDEEQHYTTLQTKAFEPLPPQRERLQQMGFDLNSGSIDPKGLSALIAKTVDVLEALDNSERETKQVAAAYEKIVREMRLNRIGVEGDGGEDASSGGMTQSKVYGIAKPLSEMEGHYSRTRAKVLQLKATLESKDGKMSVADRLRKARLLNAEAKTLLNKLIDELYGVLSKMQGLAQLRQVVIVLGEIERGQREQAEVVQAILDALRERLLGGDKK